MLQNCKHVNKKVPGIASDFVLVRTELSSCTFTTGGVELNLGGGGGGMLLGGGGATPLIECCVNFFGDGMVEIFLSPIFDVGPRGFKNSESCNIFGETIQLAPQGLLR